MLMFIEAMIVNTTHGFTTIVFSFCTFNQGFGKLYLVGVLYADFCKFKDYSIFQYSLYKGFIK